MADRAQWPFDGPFFLLLNIAIGGTGVAQSPDDAALSRHLRRRLGGVRRVVVVVRKREAAPVRGALVRGSAGFRCRYARAYDATAGPVGLRGSFTEIGLAYQKAA